MPDGNRRVARITLQGLITEFPMGTQDRRRPDHTIADRCSRSDYILVHARRAMRGRVNAGRHHHQRVNTLLRSQRRRHAAMLTACGATVQRRSRLGESTLVKSSGTEHAFGLPAVQ
jgi:hypothetical protein